MKIIATFPLLLIASLVCAIVWSAAIYLMILHAAFKKLRERARSIFS